MTYITDRKYTDYIHENIAIPTLYKELGWREVRISDDDLKGLDIKYGTDYVFQKDGFLLTVQERFRESKYQNYTDFTIRYRRDGNYHIDRVKSEFYKITAQYFTYGITNCLKSDLSICSHFIKVAIVNLAFIYEKINSGEIEIRDNKSFRCQIENNKLICPVIHNKDGSSSFVPFDIPMLVSLWGKDVLIYSKGFGFDVEQEFEFSKYRKVVELSTNTTDIQKFITHLPVYSIKAACGYFGEGEAVDEIGWMNVEGVGRLNRNMFVVQAVGRSMEPKIYDGDYCVFQANPAGTRHGKIVLAQHRGYFDEENAGAFSIKKYESQKSFDEFGNWQHEEIILIPLNSDYEPITITSEDAEDFRVVAEFVGVLG